MKGYSSRPHNLPDYRHILGFEEVQRNSKWFRSGPSDPKDLCENLKLTPEVAVGEFGVGQLAC